MTEKFRARYQAQDGYVGGDRPQHFNIDASDLEEDMTDADIEEFYHEAIQDHFEQHVSPGAERVVEFIAWAKAQLSSRS